MSTPEKKIEVSPEPLRLGGTTALPDRPIRAPREDFLNRASFAHTLADQILHAPPNQTLRMGIYGGWGEGKTSVLELMRAKLEKEGQVCLWIAPWAAQTRDEVMAEVVRQLAEKLGLDTSALASATTGAKLTAGTREVAAEATWWSKAGAAIIGPAVQKHFETKTAEETERFFAAVAEKLGNRRVIIFIDDLDRVRAEFIAELLLTLREALDLPNFFYVMALAPEVVQRGLAGRHAGWGTATEFLEKIIEFPWYLPQPTDRDIQIFLQRGEAVLGSAVDGGVLQSITSLLPRNPRKLKLYLRLLASLRGLLDRFDAAELDLTTLYIVQLLRSEFPEQLQRLLSDDATNDLERGKVLDHMDREKKDAGAVDHSAKYLPDEKDQRRKDRFNQLYAAARERGGFLRRGRYDIRALLTLPDQPPLLTWKELNTFVDTYRTANADERLPLLRTFVSIDDVIEPRRAEAVFSLSIEMRHIVLEQAADAALEEDRRSLIDEAAFLGDLLGQFTANLSAFSTPLLPISSWKKLVGHTQRWAHFEKLPDYDALRAQERDLVKIATDTMADELRASALDSFGWDFEAEGQEAPQFTKFVGELRDELRRWAARHIIHLFTTPDGLEAFWGDRGSPAMKSLLFDPTSLLLSDEDLRNEFETVAATAKGDPVVQRNFYQYVRMLQYGATEGGTFGRNECRGIIRSSPFAPIAWGAALAKPLNPRVVGGLRQRRTRLITDGVLTQDEADERLPIPTWWQALEGTFFDTSA